MSDSAKTPMGAGRTVACMAPRFQVIGLVVAEMAASLDFYRALGFELPADADEQPHVELALPGGPTIAWDTRDTIRSFDASWAPPAGGHGSHLEPWDAFWGQRYATVLDPDGNVVDLFAPLG
jgi:catechol 2,3-dioxygenase-like lactoylglutathione lyase family enzyme